jgi:hypothetical protein
MGNERLLAVAAPFIGEAAEQRAYYVLMTKKSPESDPWALLSSTSSDDLKWGKFPWLPLAGSLIAIIVIGLFLQRMEIEKPLKHLRAEVHSLAKQQLTKIEDTKYGGKLGGIARDINAAIEHFTHAPLPKSETAKKDISAILDPRAASADGRSFDVSNPAIPAKSAVPAPAAMAASLFGTPRSAPGLGGGPPAIPAAPPPSPFTAPAEPAPFLAPSLPQHAAPPPPVAAHHMPPPRPLPPPAKPAMAPAPVHPPASDGHAHGTADPDLAHFARVFDEYVALRQKCGESIVGLSVEKFTAKLQSNRQQIIAKHNCRTAQFTVYEKDGKAALRAVPVRD